MKDIYTQSEGVVSISYCNRSGNYVLIKIYILCINSSFQNIFFVCLFVCLFAIDQGEEHLLII